MATIEIMAILVSTFTVTSYRSVPEQTDATPFITSIGQFVHPHGVAVSQDLLKNGTFRYGDHIYIEGLGIKVVNDTTNARLRNHVDVWVPTYADEKAIGWRKNVRIYRINVRKQRINVPVAASRN